MYEVVEEAVVRVHFDRIEDRTLKEKMAILKFVSNVSPPNT